MQDYYVTVVYKCGKLHLGADSLSCSPLSTNTHQSNLWYTADSTAFPDTVDLTGKLADLSLRPIIPYLSGDVAATTLRTMHQAKLFHIRYCVLYRRNYEPHKRPWLLVIPCKLQQEIFKAYHDNPSSGHLGVAKIYFRIRANSNWNDMRRTNNKYVRSCHHCQTKKSPSVRLSGTLRSLAPIIVHSNESE